MAFHVALCRDRAKQRRDNAKGRSAAFAQVAELSQKLTLDSPLRWRQRIKASRKVTKYESASFRGKANGGRTKDGVVQVRTPIMHIDVHAGDNSLPS